MIITPHWPIPLGSKPIDLGLERMEAFLKKLGNPEKKLPPVVHVAGTNGKGSTLAFLRAMLEAAGYKVHVYTSPHLVCFNERIVLAGKQIDDALLTQTLDECKAAAEGLTLTFFEGTTAAAILAMSRVPADIVLLETGLGGRLDATNVIENPALTILTSISFDHMEFLGDTIEKIAFEKAAIMKKQVPCVVAQQKPEVMEVIRHVAEQKSAMLFAQGYGWRIERQGSDIFYISSRQKIALKELSLEGVHQHLNAGAAIACMEYLPNVSFTAADIQKGLSSAKWPARLQRITTGPLKKYVSVTSDIFLDGGHNPECGGILADYIRQENSRVKKSNYLVMGMLKNKDARGYLSSFKDVLEGLIAIPIKGEANAFHPAALADIASGLGIWSSEADHVAAAMSKIEKRNPGRKRIFIAGSLYLAGTVLAEFQNKS